MARRTYDGPYRSITLHQAAVNHVQGMGVAEAKALLKRVGLARGPEGAERVWVDDLRHLGWLLEEEQRRKARGERLPRVLADLIRLREVGEETSPTGGGLVMPP